MAILGVDMSETNKHRSLFLPYCKGNGLDLGFGGDKIVPSAIGVDLPQGQRYAFEGDNVQNIECDASNLYMFANGGMDYLYSSHLIEDFEDTKKVLIEWLRVIKQGGYLCLLFPNEQIYRQRGFNINQNHKHIDFGLQYVKNIIEDISKDYYYYYYYYELHIIHAQEHFENHDYNCSLIIQKGCLKFNNQYYGHFPKVI